MASAAFVFTVLLGFLIQRPDSFKWWFGGLFFQGGRTGFTGWEGNQSLRGLLTRLSGSVAGAQTSWIIAAVLISAPATTKVTLRNVVYSDVHQASESLQRLVSENTK